MKGRVALGRAALAVLLLAPASGCGAIAQKAAAAREFAAAMKPGHAYQSFSANNEAMAPAIPIGATLLVDKSAYTASPPQRGDIVVFMPPVQTKNPFIKRIVATPGDAVAVRNGTVLVNGRPLPKPFPPLHPDYDVTVANYHIIVDGRPLDAAVADVPFRGQWSAPDRLPRGCYFLLGDRVMNSEDSHVWGCAEFRGTFATGERSGEATLLVGKVVKVVDAGR